VRVLITGITGFVGPYLAAHIAETEPTAEIWGLKWGELAGDAAELLGARIRLIEGDVTDSASLKGVLGECRPEAVIHLAAASSVARSWSNVARALSINAVGTARLLEAICETGRRPVTVVASSAEVYGRVSSTDGPVREDAPLAPVSPYGTSKVAQDLLAAQYAAAYGLPVVRLRPFHLTGPRRPAHFVGSSFAEQIARIEGGFLPPVLEVGNLDAVRDITDVRDAARAYWLAITQGAPGEVYNLCSGRELRIAELVERLFELSHERIEVRVDPGRLRTDDIPWLVGDHTRLSEATGWQPEIPIDRTLADLLDWWRSAVGAIP
jgi:GDP-4-dehydro-6-deoxy-D-mannose reductase